MSSLAIAQDDSVRKELEALYAKRDQAVKAKDANSFKSLLADDYTEKDKDGKITNRVDSIKEIEKNFADKDVKETSSSTKIEGVKQGKDGNEMLVDTSQVQKMTAMMDGQLHQLEFNGKYRDTWVRTDAGWKLKYSEMLDITMSEVEAAWSKYTSPEGRYSVSFPGQPKLETDESKKPKSYTASVLSLPTMYAVSYFDAQDESFLDDWRDGEIKRLKESKGTILGDNPESSGGYPGRQLVTLEKDSSGTEWVRGIRVYRVEGRIYMVIFTYPKSSESDALKAKGTKFFDSFQITKKP